MIPFKAYYGHSIYIVPSRVLYVEQGSCGSRGISCNVRLDTGETICLNDDAERVQRVIAEALAG
jgi:hypothetical protein